MCFLELAELLAKKVGQGRPTVVCLCGSTRFSSAFREAKLRETLAGNIITTIGCDTKSDQDLALAGMPIDKEKLDTLHLWKIDLADEILVLNQDHYIGESTRREIEYAVLGEKAIRWLLPPTEQETSLLQKSVPAEMPAFEEPASVLIETTRPGWAVQSAQLLEFASGEGAGNKVLALEYAILHVRVQDAPAGHPVGYFPLRCSRISLAKKEGIVISDFFGEAGFSWLTRQPVALLEQAVTLILDLEQKALHLSV